MKTLERIPRPRVSLPLDSRWACEDDYVQSLLSFATSSDLFRNLCGGVHILDFLTREPDLYTTVLPAEWRDWFDLVEIEDVLQLLLRADLSSIQEDGYPCTANGKGVVSPPQTLV